MFSKIGILDLTIFKFIGSISLVVLRFGSVVLYQIASLISSQDKRALGSSNQSQPTTAPVNETWENAKTTFP